MKRLIPLFLAAFLIVAVPLFGCKGAEKVEGGGDAAQGEDYKGAPPGAETKPEGTTPETGGASTPPSTPSSGF